MTRATVIAFAIAACLVPGAAQAQTSLPPPPAPPPGWVAPPAFAPYAYPTVPIQLDVTEPGVDVLVFPPGADVEHDAPIARCAGACVVNLTPGKYKIYVTETDATVSGSRTLELRGPTRLVMDPDMETHRSVGLVLGITGPIMMLIGLAAALSENSVSCESNGRCDDYSQTVGVVGLLGGLVATPVGWVMYGTSFKPEYELQPLASPGYGRIAPSIQAKRALAPVGLQWRLSF